MTQPVKVQMRPRGRKRFVNYETCEKIRAAYNKGFTFADLEIEFGIAKSTVSELLHYRGAYAVDLNVEE